MLPYVKEVTPRAHRRSRERCCESIQKLSCVFLQKRTEVNASDAAKMYRDFYCHNPPTTLPPRANPPPRLPESTLQSVSL